MIVSRSLAYSQGTCVNVPIVNKLLKLNYASNHSLRFWSLFISPFTPRKTLDDVWVPIERGIGEKAGRHGARSCGSSTE